MGLSQLEMPTVSTPPSAAPAGAPDDAALVGAARGDRRAFGALYDRYADAIYRFSYLRLRDGPAAEDATSQVFLKAMQRLPQFRDGVFAAWLFRIAHNVVTDVYRREKPAAPLEDAELVRDPAPAPEEEALRAAEREAFYQAVAELPEEQRTVLELTLAGLNGPEIAAALGRTHASVKMLRWRGLETIKVRVRQQGLGGEVQA